MEGGKSFSIFISVKYNLNEYKSEKLFRMLVWNTTKYFFYSFFFVLCSDWYKSFDIHYFFSFTVWSEIQLFRIFIIMGYCEKEKNGNMFLKTFLCINISIKFDAFLQATLMNWLRFVGYVLIFYNSSIHSKIYRCRGKMVEILELKKKRSFKSHNTR